MTLVERVTQDLTAAMKAQDAARVSVLRMAKAALKNREIEKRQALDDAESTKVLQGLVKQREDLAEKERAEIAVLKGYLPESASDADIFAAVEKAIADTGAASSKDLGRVMKAALSALAEAGRPADGRRVNEVARTRLGG